MQKNSLVIATRASRLALWQSEHIAARLRAIYPQLTVTLLPLSTKGDEILDRSLAKIGGKGLFIKELEIALLEGRADFAVHSLKDVPVDLDPRFCLAAITEREDARDALVGCADLSALKAGSVIGTSSLRRAAQLLAQFPQLVIEPLRGNLDTRLAKLDSGAYAAIVLAASGLKRLGYTQRIAAYFEPAVMLPAAGQGALGIECLGDNTAVKTMLQALHHAPTAQCVLAERHIATALQASCSTPLAAYAWREGEALHLQTWVAKSNGEQAIKLAFTQSAALDANALAAKAAAQLIEQGALKILAQA